MRVEEQGVCRIYCTWTMSLSAKRPLEDTLTSSPSSSSIAADIKQVTGIRSQLQSRDLIYILYVILHEQFRYTVKAFIGQLQSGTPCLYAQTTDYIVCKVIICRSAFYQSTVILVHYSIPSIFITVSNRISVFVISGIHYKSTQKRDLCG